jgi:hypothetical protein
VKKLSSGFSRLLTVLPINLLEIAGDSRSKQSCRLDAGRKDIQGMIWPFSTEITPSVVCVSK